MKLLYRAYLQSRCRLVEFRVDRGFSVLLVDDDDNFRGAVMAALEGGGLRSVQAHDGLAACEILKTTTFDLIVSDIRMEKFSGIELVKWVSANCPTPMILMTGFKNLLETKQASELGVGAFLNKPFLAGELLSTIEEVLKKPNEAGCASPKPPMSEDQFCKVSIEDFVVGKTMPFNIYIKFSATKFVRIAHTGADIELRQIKNYKNKGVTHLYLKQEDYAKLVGFNLNLAKALTKESSVSIEKKQNFLRYTGEVLLEQAFMSELDQATFVDAKEFVQTSLQLISNDDTAFNLLTTLNSHSDTLYAHSIGVSTFAVMISKSMGWDSPNTAYRLSLSALFHDIGKKELSRELISKPRALLTPMERAEIESHVLRGRDILQGLRSMPEEVIQVAYQHHENCLGNGYPSKIKKAKIHPFARLVSVANVFCEYVIQTPEQPALSCAEALQQMQRRHVDEFDKDVMDALAKLIEKK